MRVLLSGALLLWLLALAFVCRGQEYLFARYTPRDGLVNSRARFLYQDSKGRLYVSTFGGLSVYDGSRFVNYTTENGLSTGMVNDIIEVGDDSLLIVPNSRAMHVMVHGVIRNIETTDHYYPITNQLIKCSDGFFYAIADDGVFRWEKGRFVKIPLVTAGGKEVGPYLISAVESGGKLFILTDPFLGGYPGQGALIVYDVRTHRVLTLQKPYFFSSLARSPSGEVIISATDGTRAIDPASLNTDTIRLLPLPAPYAAAGRIHSDYIRFDREGNLWLCMGKEVIKADRNGTLTTISAAGDLPVGALSSVFEDHEGNIWVTNSQDGIARLQSEEVRWYPTSQPDFTVNDFFARPTSDSVWCYDWSRHRLMLLVGGSRQIFQAVGPLPPFGHVLFNQSAWMISLNTIYQLHFLPGNRFQATLAYQDTVVIDGRNSMDLQGNLILPSSRLTVVGTGRAGPAAAGQIALGQFVLGQTVVPNLADQVGIDQYNRLWVVTRSNEVLLFKEEPGGGRIGLRMLGSWKATPGASPRSIAVDRAGRVWVGTRDHGLFCLFFDGLKIRAIRQLTMKNGLSENFIRCLYCDPDNTLWAGTPSGLDLIRWQKDSCTVTNVVPGHQMSVEKIDRSAGGVHWVFTVGGYLQILPSKPLKVEYRPPVLFSKIMVGSEIVPYVPGRPLALRYDQNALSFNVGVPSFTDESLTRFSYLLEGSNDARWSAPSNQSSINFVNLPPGDYVLRVKAQFLSGIYPDETGDYPFRIRPPWWQTVMFRITLAVLLAAGVGWAIRDYTRRRLDAQRVLLERQRAIEKERTRIATDMHDDLGAGLSRIKFLSDTIGIKQQRSQPIDDEISGIRDYSREMIDKMGEIVWALNQKNDLLSDLLSYTRSYAATYLLQAGIRSRIEAPEEFPYRIVSGEFRRNVYLAVKEALHNVVKHSQAQEVYIRMEAGKELVIVLQDDGIGFDRAAIRPFANGLHNMERRIGELGGTLTVQTGNGTTIVITAPV
jgi:signal transduction histidine kinase/ligand-binding sensor domain-containing protein